MKKFTCLALSLMLLSNTNLQGQNWINGGNSLSATGRIGTNTNYDFVIKTNNLERARITKAGLWGFGSSAPTAKFHINSTTSQDPLKVQVNGSTKLFVHRNGGVSVGTSSSFTPPNNGLFVTGFLWGNAGIHAEDGYQALTGIANTTNTSSWSTGVYGSGPWTGVYGISNYGLGRGVHGYNSSTGNGGLFVSENGTGLEAGTINGDYAAFFYGDTHTTGNNYEGSDKSLKKNIQEAGNAMSIINKLKPKHYQFRDDGIYASMRLPKGNHYGLLAQDVEEVLPHLVKETTHRIREYRPQAAIKSSADGKPVMPTINREPSESIKIKAVNYNEFIPLLIKAQQEQDAKMQKLDARIEKQNATIEQQAVQIEELRQLVIKLTQNPNSTGFVKHTDSYLSQSAPNPSKNSTRINYTLPLKTNKAELIVFNAAGQKVREIQLDNSGSVEIDTSSFSAGTYSYSLYTNDNFVESKKFMVAR